VYLEHFGLRERPFSILPDPGFLLLTQQHGHAATMLEYGLTSEAMIGVLTGEVGSGKTTMVRHLLAQLPADVTVGLVNAVPDDSVHLLRWVNAALGVACEGDAVQARQAFEDFLIAEYAAGRRVLLILDEAQNLGIQRLEELRLLTNINADKHLVLQLLLVGQPELREMLASPSLRQFAQRVGIDFHLRPLDGGEALQYVQHRIAVAGGAAELFQPGAVQVAHVAAAGVPRLINQLCDMALVYAFADRHDTIDETIMRQVVRERAATVASAAARNGPGEPELVAPVVVAAPPASPPAAGARSESAYGWNDARPPSCDYLGPRVFEVLAELQARRVLDLGCGNGVLCAELAQRGYDVVGIERDAGGVAAARQLNPRARIHQFGVEDDPQDLLRAEAPFDAVVSTEVIEHLYAPHRLPQFAHSCLRRGGHLIVTTPYHGYLKNLALSLSDHWDRHHTPLWHGGHIKFWSRRTLTQLLQEHGFEVVSFSGVGRVPWLWKSMVLVARKP
jgi:type II secretory pathway predicted ATPase ExeA/2-polyprenyl-3-methyl-5-hydroxy-6-metoxy-1,4-benzoquinol methylase